MSIIRITKQFTFEAAHALYGHDGACRNIHGHSYKLEVTLIGTPINQPGHPKHGMVMDFSDLKKIVNKEILTPFDHALIIDANSPYAKHDFTAISQKLNLVPYQPTCENMLIDFSEKIKSNLPPEVKLHSLKLHETGTSFAEWYAGDNLF
ncbi:MAG: 6-carboxytetrahydropterin synthase [Bacteroidetes bacterium]|nr:6-carboxytetrahydropterin synthase [Bacteroidota bacterium]